MSSVDEFSAAIGAAAESVETVAAGIAKAKNSGDELSGKLAAAGVEGRVEATNAVSQRLESEATVLAAQLKDLLGEIQQQAEALRGLEGAPGAGAGVGSSSSAQPRSTLDQQEPPGRSSQSNHMKPDTALVDVMKRIGWPTKPGRPDDIRARGMLYSTNGTPWNSEPLRASRQGPASKRTDLKEPWASDPEMTTSWHIEANAAALMVKFKERVAILYINQSVCGSQEPFDPKRCHDNLRKILPKGYTLYVHSVLRSGWTEAKRYEGTGEALK